MELFRKNQENEYNIGDKFQIEFEIYKIQKEYGKIIYGIKSKNKNIYSYSIPKEELQEIIIKKETK